MLAYKLLIALDAQYTTLGNWTRPKDSVFIMVRDALILLCNSSLYLESSHIKPVQYIFKSSMSPIRVGMIGLSARTKTSWASNAHLPYLKASNDKYVITALCNSSVSAAQAAIEAYNFPASTKAYGSPEDLANDGEVCLY